MKDVPLKIGMSDDHLQAIGHVAAQWSFLEAQVDLNLAALAYLHNISASELPVAEPFKVRLAALRDLVQKTDDHPDRINAMLETLDRIGAAMQNRNRVIHARWNKPRSNRLVAFATTGTRPFKWTLSIRRINQIALQAAKLNSQMLRLFVPRGYEPPP